jgi:glycine cleavage system H protein
MVAIFVALLFLGFILTDLLVQRIAARRKQEVRPLAGAATPASPQPLSWSAPRWEVPEGVYVANGHSWLRPEADGRITLGADPFLGYALGSARNVVLPRVGAWVKKGDPLFHLALHGGSLTVPSPVEGVVAGVNGRLEERPGLATEEPYSSGWVCSILPDRPRSALSSLPSGSRAAAWLDREFRRFCEFVSGQASHDLALGATSPDGGLAAPGCLSYLDPGAWTAFEAQFLRS